MFVINSLSHFFAAFGSLLIGERIPFTFSEVD
jgi:hypothetical protein